MREFADLGSFARHLARLAGEGEAVTSRCAKRGAEVVRDDAQNRIGWYQDAVGGWPAWAPLADATVRDRISKGFSPFEPLLRTGGLRDSIKVEVNGGEAVVGSESKIALYQEAGTEKIPPRPFLGPAGFSNRHQIGAAMAVVVVAWIAGESWRRPPQSIKLP